MKYLKLNSTENELLKTHINRNAYVAYRFVQEGG